MKYCGKFEVGNIIVANEKSNEKYLITNKQNGCVAKVVVCEFDPITERNLIEIEVVKHNLKGEIGNTYTVEEKYFENDKTKVYLASPFFNEVEIERMEKVRDILRDKGLDVFVPNEHQHKDLEFGSREWRSATFKSDVGAIDRCDVMVAIISNGNYDDSGTAWEIGYAYANEIPVILVNLTGETINLMIADSLHALITSCDELKEYDFDKLETIEYENYVW